MAKQRRKLTAAEKKVRHERRRKCLTIFINGKQKRVPRPPESDGMPVDEFIAHNTDPIWRQQNELWGLMPDVDCFQQDADDNEP